MLVVLLVFAIAGYIIDAILGLSKLTEFTGPFTCGIPLTIVFIGILYGISKAAQGERIPPPSLREFITFDPPQEELPDYTELYSKKKSKN